MPACFSALSTEQPHGCLLHPLQVLCNAKCSTLSKRNSGLLPFLPHVRACTKVTPDLLGRHSI